MTEQLKQSDKELYEKYASLIQLELMSIQDDYANFKEYDGNGHFKYKVTLRRVKNFLKQN